MRVEGCNFIWRQCLLRAHVLLLRLRNKTCWNFKEKVSIIIHRTTWKDIDILHLKTETKKKVFSRTDKHDNETSEFKPSLTVAESHWYFQSPTGKMFTSGTQFHYSSLRSVLMRSIHIFAALWATYVDYCITTDSVDISPFLKMKDPMA
jgi:hypothetical protein